MARTPESFSSQPQTPEEERIRRNEAVISAVREAFQRKFRECVQEESVEAIAARIQEFLTELRTEHPDAPNRLGYQILVSGDTRPDPKLMWNRQDFDTPYSILDFIHRGFRSVDTGSSIDAEQVAPISVEGGGAEIESQESREMLLVTNRDLGCHVATEGGCGAHLVFPNADARVQFASMQQRQCPECKRQLGSQSIGFSEFGKGFSEQQRKVSDSVKRPQKFFYTRRGGKGYMVANPDFFAPFETDGYEYDEGAGSWKERRMHVSHAE